MRATTERDAQFVLREGFELAGRYRLERLLGEGGMGVVWEARQLTTQKLVAIKILKNNNESADAARFLREARVAASLSHRNIVQVFDFWEVEGGGGPVFMVMELLRGETLAALLSRVGRLSFEGTRAILVPVASALRAAHTEGVVHRDLKPDNVFLSQAPSDGGAFEVKVVDFGLAKPMVASAEATALTQTGSVMGTPFYMAPEQVYGEKDIDARADVWALGVVLYECLTGSRPFQGENYGQVFKAISNGAYRPIRELAPDLPESIEKLVARMLAHDREARLSGVAEVTDALLGGAPASTQAMPVPATVRLASQPPRADSSGARGAPPAALATPDAPGATMLSASSSVKTVPLVFSTKVLTLVGVAALLGGVLAVVVAVVLSARASGPASSGASSPTRATPITASAPPPFAASAVAAAPSAVAVPAASLEDAPTTETRDVATAPSTSTTRPGRKAPPSRAADLTSPRSLSATTKAAGGKDASSDPLGAGRF